MAVRRVRFAGGAGAELAGLLEEPDVSPRAFALFAHCFTCTKDYKAYVNLSRALAEAGFAVLRFDFTGLGESRGDFAKTGFATNVADLAAAWQAVAEPRGLPGLLVGHSLGGAAAIRAGRRIGAVRAVATLAAPSDPASLLKLLVGREDQLRAEGRATVLVSGRPFELGASLMEDLKGASFAEDVALLGKPLMVLHSPSDEVVPLRHAAAIFQAAAHPKSFVALDGADHLLSRPADGLWAGRLIAAWAGRYLL